MTQTIGLSPAASAPDTRLNRLLKAVCAVLIVFIASQLVVQIASIPSFYQRVLAGQVPTLTTGAEISMSNELIAGWAADRGMSLSTFAVYWIIYNLVMTVGFVSVAVLILLKARREWFHWFTAMVLLFYPTGGLWVFTQVSQIAYTYVALSGVLWPSFLVFLFLFPNGRPVPRWALWIMAPLVLGHLVVQTLGLLGQFGLLPDPGLLEAISALFVVVPVAFVVILLSQIYRYWRGSTPTERAQIRWFVAGLAFEIVASTILAPGDESEALGATGLRGDLSALLQLFIPLSIGIAILRYRLYDIDVLIRRTLIYGVLTAALALVYFGAVVVLQRIVGFRAGETSQWVIVVSTLIIAALFRPLHSRIQQLIDRRFYRRRYNAQETLAAFSAKLRSPDTVSLDNVTGELLGVVQDTVHPAHLSMWLLKTSPQAERNPSEHNPPAVR